jgi:hypothetical protein
VNYSITGSDNNLLYSLQDASGVSYATSKFGSGSSLTVPSNVFNTPGTYNLFLVADKLFGGTCSMAQAVSVQVTYAVLPTKFIDLAAKKSESHVNITWSVASESNVSHYQIERSIDCNTYHPIGTVAFIPSTRSVKSYNFIDKDASTAAKVCYRIVQVDVSGNNLYSNTVSLTSGKQLNIYVAPNPAFKESTVYIPSTSQQLATIELLDMNGRKVLTKKVKLHAGENAVTIFDLNSYGKGHYLVKVYDNSGVHFSKLVIK